MVTFVLLFNLIILLNFDAMGEVIFRGQASVTNGFFEFEFIVPRGIAGG